MMTTGEPRGLSGIDDAILEAACLAARRSGLSVSDWLNGLIARQARVERTAPGRPRRDDADEDALAAAIERLTRRIRGMDDSSRAVLTEFQGRLDEIAARLGAAAGARRRGADSSLTEIAGIVEDLSRDIDDADEAARSTVEGMCAGRGQDTQTRHVNQVAEAIRHLERRLSSTSDAPAARQGAAPPTSLDTIRARLEALLAATPEALPDADLETTLRSLDSHIDEASSRLLGGCAGGDLSSAVAEISERQRSIDEEVDLGAIARAQHRMFESLDTLHDGVVALGDRLAVLLDPVEGATDSTSGNDRLSAIEGEIAAIRRTLEAAESPRAVTRVEIRIAELARAVEAVLAAANTASRSVAADAIGKLEAKLDTVHARIDVLLDQSNPSETLKEIKAEISLIRQDIGERDLPEPGEMEAQIAALAHKLDAARESDRCGPAVKELEQQVARLASELERALPQTASLEDVAIRLSRLQDLLSANQRESVEAARMAARDAAQEVAESARGGDIVDALKQDLENIRRVAWAADSRSQESLNSVQATLGRVVERLARLESGRDREVAVARQSLRATGTYGAGAPLPRAEPVSTEGNPSSLEPNIVRPDLAALRELARSAAHGERHATTDRKADFIAAARRAAKTAPEESVPPSSKDPGDGNPGTFARISQAIRNRRRTLLILAAASLLAASAVHMFGGASVAPLSVSTAESVYKAGKPSTEAVEAGPSPTLYAGDKATGPVAEKPASDDLTVFAFAAPARLDGQFDDMPLAPPTQAFVRAPHRAASLPLDEAIGSAELRKAAAAGNANAAVEVAARYAQGRRVSRDLAKAALWYELAAEEGVAVAQYRLASLYESGQGVAKDPAVAAAWYRRAAEQGNTGAMHNLAVMLSGGIDGVPNYSEAAEWFRAAADRGVEDSQYNLGVIYARGLGLDRDLVESFGWFALAAANGDPEAVAHRDEVGGALSPDDLSKARAVVQAWRPIPIPPHTNALASLPDVWSDPTDGITENERRSLVMKIQALLAEQGYDPGPADGLEGPKTRQAVRAFQRHIGLDETGAIGRDVVAALADPSG
jgi:localization factor PodJL